MELNREQIIKALECCKGGGNACIHCVYFYRAADSSCAPFLIKDALALIRELTIELDAMRCAANSYKMDNQRLTEENERLRADNEWLKREVNTHEEDYTKVAKTFYNTGKADTVRKMQERLKAKAVEDESLDGRNTIQIINAIWVDKIAKELLEEEGNER